MASCSLNPRLTSPKLALRMSASWAGIDWRSIRIRSFVEIAVLTMKKGLWLVLNANPAGMVGLCEGFLLLLAVGSEAVGQ